MIVEKPLPYMRKEAFLHGEPHACGEYTLPPYYALAYIGSSPRLWGIRCLRSHVRELPRFIPTRVGNTLKASCPKKRTTVHPHACGEYHVSAHVLSESSGSSPRVWGIRSETNFAITAPRFIPTRVGNTRRLYPRLSSYPVHPHACGEYALRARVPF